MHNIAFVESNTTGTGELFVQRAREKGLQVLFLTSKPEKYHFLKKLLIHPIIVDTSNVQEILQTLKNVNNLLGVLSSSESYVLNAACVAQKLGLPHVTPCAIENCQDKGRFVKLLDKAGLPTIPTWTSLERGIKFPVVVKPNPGTGSVGVKLCKSLDEVQNHTEALDSSFLIQEYIAGDEYSAEVLLKDGSLHTLFGITKKYLGPEPYFVEYGHDFPIRLPQIILDNIIGIIEGSLKAVGFDFGPAHVEFRIRDGQIYIIEINPRLAGGMIPVLIEQSQGIDLIGNLINLFIGQEYNFQSTSNFFTKISFVLPKQEGRISKLMGHQNIKSKEHIYEAVLYKNTGDFVGLKGDFTDRIGHIIAKAETPQQCQQAISKAISQIVIPITPITSSCAHSRLSESLNPEVKRLLENDYFSDFNDLVYLSQINKAHVKMLEICGIISASQAKSLSQGIMDLEAENFASVQSINDCSIGFYLAYEQALIDKIGLETAGLIHSGRSRNDINATIQRFKSLEIYSQLYPSLWTLRSNLLQKAQSNTKTSMPIYSQFQPAMPGTYAYYLLAVEETLKDSQTDLQNILSFLKKSTLGAVSGAGTTYPTNPTITAELLGFDTPLSNALTTVATRDVELRLLSIASCVGTTISRISQDYHLWLTQEFSFFDLPDQLCGISSAMPQKKNPYLLEKIKGKSINIIGEFVKALATIQKVPFTNSVEVSTEAFTGYAKSFSELIKAINLLSIVVREARPNPNAMKESNQKGLTIATEIAERLALVNNITIRQAHSQVGAKINESLKNGKDPLVEIMSMLDEGGKDASHWYENLEYGNGPGVKSTEHMLTESTQRLVEDQIFFMQQVQNFQPMSKLL